jgi:hypothetical protein
VAGPLIIGAEGVLLQPDGSSYAASRPVTEGLELALALKPFPTSRTTVVAATEDLDGADRFLKLNGMAHASLVGIAVEDHDEPTWLAQWHAIKRLRAGGPVSMVLTAFPDVWQQCVQSHQAVLLFARPGAVGAPETGATWAELSMRIDRKREALADAWLKS